MNPRILAAVAIVIALLFLFAACGDDDSSSSSTPTPTISAGDSINSPGQQTPNTSACTPQQLLGTFISAEGAAGHTFITLEVSHAQRACTFPGPPEVRWYDADGGGLGVPFTPNITCAAEATDFATCVFGDPIDMSPANPSPAAGATTAVRAIVSVTNISVLPTCDADSKQAHIVGLQFPDTPLDVQIQLPNDIEMQTCSAQVDLQGYGPVAGNQ
jgi:hypothetical protein